VTDPRLYPVILADVERMIPAALGDDLLALYLYGSLARPDFQPGVSDVNLWLCVRPETDMQRVREAYLPLWDQYAEALRRGPTVTTPTDCKHYSRLLPGIARSIRQHAMLMVGEDIFRQLPELLATDPLLPLAQIATETLRGSALLAAASLSDEKQVELEKLLRRAAWQLGLPPDKDPVKVLASLHEYLDSQCEQYPRYAWEGDLPAEEPPAHLPGLLAFYIIENQLVVVLPQVDLDALNAIDWDHVFDMVRDEFCGMMLATPWQLRLAAAHDMAVDSYLNSFALEWGSSVLDGCQPTERDVMRSAAELPMRVLVEQFPAQYCTVEEDGLPKLIHDVQNVLLNIQLRNEVISRRRGAPTEWPPEALPGREAPSHQRVAANFGHFRWWVEHLIADLQA